MAGNLFIKRPKFAIVISLAIILAGLISMTTLPLEQYPSITPPQVIVTANYAGASSDVITSTIAAPVGTDYQRRRVRAVPYIRLPYYA